MSDEVTSTTQAQTNPRVADEEVLANGVSQDFKWVVYPSDVPLALMKDYVEKIYGSGYGYRSYGSWSEVYQAILGRSYGHIVFLSHGYAVGFDDFECVAVAKLRVNGVDKTMEQFTEIMANQGGFDAKRFDFDGCGVGRSPKSLAEFAERFSVAEVHGWSWRHWLCRFQPTHPGYFESTAPFLPKNQSGTATYTVDELQALLDAGNADWIPLEWFYREYVEKDCEDWAGQLQLAQNLKARKDVRTIRVPRVGYCEREDLKNALLNEECCKIIVEQT